MSHPVVVHLLTKRANEGQDKNSSSSPPFGPRMQRRGCLRGREIAEFVGALARPNGAILLEFHGRERYQEEDRGVKY